MACSKCPLIDTIVPCQIYGLWKSSDDYDVTSGPVGTTNSKETIAQLAQEVEALQREKMEVS